MQSRNPHNMFESPADGTRQSQNHFIGFRLGITRKKSYVIELNQNLYQTYIGFIYWILRFIWTRHVAYIYHVRAHFFNSAFGKLWLRCLFHARCYSPHQNQTKLESLIVISSLNWYNIFDRFYANAAALDLFNQKNFISHRSLLLSAIGFQRGVSLSFSTYYLFPLSVKRWKN